MIRDKTIIYFASFMLFLLLTSYPLQAARLHKEKEYQDCWCSENGGVTEYVLPDKTRVDCLTDEYAIEFDFADNWAESIGQAMYYAIMTKKKPGVVLITESPSDERYVDRLEAVAERLGIKVWVITPQD